MGKFFLPEGYRPSLSLYETQSAIGRIQKVFQERLGSLLHLKRVTAPLFVDPNSGLNDDLNGVERPVSFDIPAVAGDGQVVHSLAKWKRMALGRYHFYPGKGFYTDMNAIRRDEELDNLHSIYVDQWDWEKVILPEHRNREYLEQTVQQIVHAICDTNREINKQYPSLKLRLEREVTFVTAQELEDLYPNLSGKERENAFLEKHPTTFIIGIGWPLNSGKPHDGRAPDYDDWSLNGDLLFWNPLLGTAVEISSMGIRVDPPALEKQLEASGCNNRRSLPFHSQLLAGELPLSIGGGIGQSRLCMLLLSKAHIGEVQASLWDSNTIKLCDEAGIPLL